MFEVLIGLIFLSSLWVFGRSLVLVCNKNDCDWLAMPIGLCLVGLIGNLLYFVFGLTVLSIQLSFLCALIPCLVMVFYRGIHRSEWGRMLAVLGLFLLLALPAFIGGEQYYVFRGNDDDHFNYINQALTLRDHPYCVYQNNILPLSLHPGSIYLAAKNFLAKDILIHGLEYLYIRPAVGLVFAVLLPDGRGNIHLLAFLYVTALLALVFPAICFAWKRVLEAYGLGKSSLLLLMGPPFAYVAGFWGQYIFDINAWSEMAALSLLLALVFQYLRLLQNLADPSTLEGKSIASQYVLTGVLAAGSFLFYPENTVLHAGLLLLATVWWCAVTRKIPGFRALVSFAIFSVVVILISSIPNWNRTIGFVQNQINFGMAPVPMWTYFDRYWFGIHGNVLFSLMKPAIVHGFRLKYWLGIHHSGHLGQIKPAIVHVLRSFDGYWHRVQVQPEIGYVSALANLILSLIGMFFVTPDYAMPFWLRYGWILFTVILAMAAVYSLAGSLFVRFRVNQTAVFLKIFFIAGVLYLLYLFKIPALWSLGKGISFLSPYLFLVLCLGLIETGKKRVTTSVWSNAFGNRIIRQFAIIFIISQIAFGVYRLWSSRDPNGIGYDHLTYPSILDVTLKNKYLFDADPSLLGPTLKNKYAWNMDPDLYAHCQGVDLYDVDEPVYREYMKQKFIYLGIPYYSSLPVMTFFEPSAGEAVGHQPSIVTDCRMGLARDADKWMTVKL